MTCVLGDCHGELWDVGDRIHGSSVHPKGDRVPTDWDNNFSQCIQEYLSEEQIPGSDVLGQLWW